MTTFLKIGRWMFSLDRIERFYDYLPEANAIDVETRGSGSSVKFTDAAADAIRYHFANAASGAVEVIEVEATSVKLDDGEVEDPDDSKHWYWRHRRLMDAVQKVLMSERYDPFVDSRLVSVSKDDMANLREVIARQDGSEPPRKTWDGMTLRDRGDFLSAIETYKETIATQSRLIADLRKGIAEAKKPAPRRVPWCGRCECHHYYGNCV